MTPSGLSAASGSFDKAHDERGSPPRLPAGPASIRRPPRGSVEGSHRGRPRPGTRVSGGRSCPLPTAGRSPGSGCPGPGWPAFAGASRGTARVPAPDPHGSPWPSGQVPRHTLSATALKSPGGHENCGGHAGARRCPPQRRGSSVLPRGAPARTATPSGTARTVS